MSWSQMIVMSCPIEWPSQHDARHDETIHDTVTWNQRYFAFIRQLAPLVYKYHVISLIQAYRDECRWFLIGINRTSSTVAVV